MFNAVKNDVLSVHCQLTSGVCSFQRMSSAGTVSYEWAMKGVKETDSQVRKHTVIISMVAEMFSQRSIKDAVVILSDMRIASLDMVVAWDEIAVMSLLRRHEPRFLLLDTSANPSLAYNVMSWIGNSLSHQRHDMNLGIIVLSREVKRDGVVWEVEWHGEPPSIPFMTLSKPVEPEELVEAFQKVSQGFVGSGKDQKEGREKGGSLSRRVLLDHQGSQTSSMASSETEEEINSEQDVGLRGSIFKQNRGHSQKHLPSSHVGAEREDEDDKHVIERARGRGGGGRRGESTAEVSQFPTASDVLDMNDWNSLLGGRALIKHLKLKRPSVVLSADGLNTSRDCFQDFEMLKRLKMNRASDLPGPKIELLHAIAADVRKGFWSCCDRKEQNSLGCCTSAHTANPICDRCGLGMKRERRVGGK
eukprot:768540-Hanusia_phi.AAC.4